MTNVALLPNQTKIYMSPHLIKNPKIIIFQNENKPGIFILSLSLNFILKPHLVHRAKISE